MTDFVGQLATRLVADIDAREYQKRLDGERRTEIYYEERKVARAEIGRCQDLIRAAEPYLRQSLIETYREALQKHVEDCKLFPSLVAKDCKILADVISEATENGKRIAEQRRHQARIDAIDNQALMYRKMYPFMLKAEVQRAIDLWDTIRVNPSLRARAFAIAKEYYPTINTDDQVEAFLILHYVNKMKER
jgi:hypothetical protein